MLDAETKRRIDTARDILVGKVPDPKSQVEQITIALIYKFMDDMDAQSEALGGKRGFFADEFAGYGWAKLMRGGLGGYEMIDLYMNAISKMPENPGIPPLFRNIFNNAFLPYHDPETLRAFLKVIDEFEYDHSERLGDAFEYLLSVLGSQGDAGQFRTPRHIIDFMVALLDPKKDETVLDPACGTAGFLISSYKHILAANADEHGHGTLTLDEKERLAVNFSGYDISPDMVRLSRVNLYLHGFVKPQIHEYDTLTSEERWAERADVILANPPFMSPKGGIRPHRRFSVQSKRSEVLFVDYIAEHLTPTGRAGIIIPEGIIFQSQNAHKQLRKMLIEDYLVAVVSLPSGVFQPYSGVKTSILILDKSLAKKTDRIAFFKVANDGFDLGAQRRPIAENDLPQVQAELAEYLRCLRTGESVDAPQVAEQGIKYTAKQGLIVGKERIAEGGEYNLSGERYRENDRPSCKYSQVPLGEVVEILDSLRRPITKHNRKPGPYPYYGATGVLDYVEGYLFDEPLILVGEDGAKWEAGDQSAFPVNGKVWVNNHAHVLRPNRNQILDTFLIEILNEMDLSPYITGLTVPKLNQGKLKSIQIPLPPLEVQQEIVAEIEGYQRVIDGARAVVENYRPHIAIEQEWPIVALGEVISLEYGKSLKAENRIEGPYPVYGSNGIVGYHNQYLIEGPTIIVGRKGSAGAVNFSELPCYPIDTTFFVHIKDRQRLDIRFCYYQLLALELDKVNVQSGVPGLNRNDAYRKMMALPALSIQQKIVAEIEAEQALVDGNRELIERFEEKIRDAVGRVWGE